MILAIFDAIAAVPKILGYIEVFAKWITLQVADAKVRQLNAEMAKAAELAKEKKDTSGIDQLFDSDKKK